MSLLVDIENAAIDSKTSLSDLLRKCKVLAHRLGNIELANWIESELNGYASIDSLPDYRILSVHSKGNFSGYFGRQLKNADIPMKCIPETYRKNFANAHMVSSVASLESLVASANQQKTSAQVPWSPDFVSIIGSKIYEDMNCLQAWKVIPTGAIVGILETVRNRILNFTLQISSEAPNIGEIPLSSEQISNEKVTQYFNTYITGNIQNLATHSSNVTQNVTHNPINDKIFADLLEALSKIETSADITENVATKIKEMKQSTHEPANFKQKYKEFMSLLADHMQVLQPMTSFLPSLASLL